MPVTEETKNYRFNHTMLRVKDPKRSLEFYENVLGMTLLHKMENEGFTLYFLGYEHCTGEPFQREAVLELTHNHGTENDENFSYHNGNTQPQGFGHIAISVDDVAVACERFEKLGVRFHKRPQDGKMKSIAFLLDPDNYWIEIVPAKGV